MDNLYEILNENKIKKNKLNNLVVEMFYNIFGVENSLKNTSEIKISFEKIYYKISGQKYGKGGKLKIISSDTAKQNLMDKLVDILKLIEADNDNLIHEISEVIGLHFTSLRPQDWNDNTFDLYQTKLVEVVGDILGNNEKEINDDESINLIYNEENNEVRISFHHQELSPIGNMILQNLIDQLDMAGRSLTENEKMNLLNKLIGQLNRNR